MHAVKTAWSIRLLDLTLALVLLPFGMTLFIFSMIISALFIGFPPFYKASRVGKGGKGYTHWKIRSMRKGRSLGREYLEQERINGAGRLIRGAHLDELPELGYILLGKMSFVGPRPLEQRHLQAFDTAFREQVKPGWTGLAQLKLARKGILMGPEQMMLDAIYIKKRSLSYNLRILGATVMTFLPPRNKRNMDPEANAYRQHYPH
jgi:lipopolysaccharide/colanic/teichoic acid biosynthesis glycosyltransferase